MRALVRAGLKAVGRLSVSRTLTVSTAALGLVLAASVTFGTRPAALSQASQEQPQPPPVFRTEANYVRVDVYPTRDGKPVLDLTAADFQIAEDGVAQKVESFEHIVARKPEFPEERPAGTRRPAPDTTVTDGTAAIDTATVSPLIERDPSVNKSLLLRLIAGVRGL